MPSRYDASTKAKAIRLVREHRADYATECAAITAVAGRLGMSPTAGSQMCERNHHRGMCPSVSTARSRRG